MVILFYVMIGVLLLSIFYPRKFESREEKVLLHLPLVAIPLFLIYEIAMPPEMNIRVDLLYLLPLFGVSILVYAFKCHLYTKQRDANTDNDH